MKVKGRCRGWAEESIQAEMIFVCGGLTMLLELIRNGEFYPSKKVALASLSYIEALKTCEKLME